MPRPSRRLLLGLSPYLQPATQSLALRIARRIGTEEPACLTDEIGLGLIEESVKVLELNFEMLELGTSENDFVVFVDLDGEAILDAITESDETLDSILLFINGGKD
ncbi:hypothetical protein HG530_007153 [Fusarium avenaceum]|nr:hypothetical protein HG530_007153 [Fusarium avenaceum]